jgi:hypothetical protein
LVSTRKSAVCILDWAVMSCTWICMMNGGRWRTRIVAHSGVAIQLMWLAGLEVSFNSIDTWSVYRRGLMLRFTFLESEIIHYTAGARQEAVTTYLHRV